jgi:hypothetical protein
MQWWVGAHLRFAAVQGLGIGLVQQRQVRQAR